ncbi:MAG: hypothetical protein AMXMBFR81_10210 [Chthonomonas sp.]
MIATLVAAVALAAFRQDAPCTFRLIASVETVKPGASFWVAGEYTMKPEWHVYWLNPGDSGLPTTLDIQLPEGWAIGKLQWPAPHRFDAAGLINYGYERKVLLMAEVQTPATAKPGSYALAAKASWLACKEEYVPGQGQGTVNVTVGDALRPSSDAAVFESFRKELPLRTKLTGRATPTTEGYRLEVQPLGDRAPDEAYFYAASGEALSHSAKQAVSWSGGKLVLDVKRSEYSSKTPKELRGVLVVVWGKERSAYEVSLGALSR